MSGSVSMVSSSFDSDSDDDTGMKVYQFDNDIDDAILINFTTKLANDIRSDGTTGSNDRWNRRGIISRVYNKAMASSRVRFKSRRLVRER